MRLLLAEDELALSKALKAILERNKYSVDAVYDGQEALDYLNAGNNYDGVILDIMMPKIDGIAVLKEIRARGKHRGCNQGIYLYCGRHVCRTGGRRRHQRERVYPDRCR